MSLRFPNRTNPSQLPAPVAAALLIVLFVAGCATRQPAPVEDRSAPPSTTPAPSTPPSAGAVAQPDARPQTYTVKKGDTLHQIALDNGFDYRELAAWNNIENPNVIRVGQVLRLSPPGETAGSATAT